MATTLAARNDPRETDFDRMKAAVPRSRSVATAPIARMIAANAPNWARFFHSWSTASAGGRGRDADARRAGRRRPP